MRVLVTGGAGFIGSNFVRWTVEHRREASIVVLDSFTYAAAGRNLETDGWLRANADRVEVVKADIRDTATVDLLVANTDVVVHFAAESHNDVSLVNPLLFIDVNVGGTGVLLEAVRKHKVRFHHISTDEVFGDLGADEPAFTVSSPYRPSSPYAASKAAADHLVRAWVRSFGVNATISNCSNNYGPWQHVEKFIPRQITELLEGRAPRVYGSGGNVRDWINVQDHCEGIWASIDRGATGQTYLLGSHNEHTNLEIVSVLLEIFGKQPDDFIHVQDRPGHDFRYAIDTSQAREELNWVAPQRHLYDEMEALVGWYQTQQDWWKPLKDATEQNYALTGQ